MAEAFPRSRFTGVDLSNAAIGAGRQEAERNGLGNASTSAMPLTSARTAGSNITIFDAAHDQARPDLLLAGIAKALRPGRVYPCVENAASSELAGNLEHPRGPFLYTISCMHGMTVSLADGGMGLGAMRGKQAARTMLGEAGFTRSKPCTSTVTTAPTSSRPRAETAYHEIHGSPDRWEPTCPEFREGLITHLKGAPRRVP
jgi:hypothetical protein